MQEHQLKHINLLSIDIDGNDYYIWESISNIHPDIIVIEYNALLGSQQSISIPYQENFLRHQAHHSGLYFGASIQALINLAQQKQYIFVGADLSGTNLFFIHKRHEEKCKNIQIQNMSSYTTRHQARQARDQNGELTLSSPIENIKTLQSLEFFDTIRKSKVKGFMQ